MDLTLRAVAEFLRVLEPTVMRWVKDEGLSAFLINGRYRFNRVDLLEWANRRKLPVAREIMGSIQLSDDMTLVQALQAGGVHRKVPGADVKSVMEAVAERLPLSSCDRAVAAQVLMEREKQGATTVGDGVAIPHARNPLIFSIEHPIVALCFLERAVDFGATDGKPVRALFVLLTPTIRQHLALLSQLATSLHSRDFRECVSQQAPADEILARLRHQRGALRGQSSGS